MTSRPRGGVHRRAGCIAAPTLDWLNKGVLNSVDGGEAAGVIHEMCLVG